MKHLKLLGLIALFFTCFAGTCKKEENKPAPQNPAVVRIDESQLIGKWECIVASWTYYKPDGSIESQQITDNTGDNRQQNLISWMTFAADHTYNHTKDNGLPEAALLADNMITPGTWEMLNDNQSIKINTNVWNAVAFSASSMKLSCKLTDSDGAAYETVFEFRK